MTLALPRRDFRLADYLEPLVWSPASRTTADLLELFLLLTPNAALPTPELAGDDALIATATREAAQRSVLLTRSLGIDLRWCQRSGTGRHRHVTSLLAVAADRLPTLGDLLRRGAMSEDPTAAAACAIWRAALLACSRVRSTDGSVTVRFPTGERARRARTAAGLLGVSATIEPTARGELRHRVHLDAGEAYELTTALLGDKP